MNLIICDDHSACGGSVIWVEDLSTGCLEWKRICNETFTSVVLYPYHVLLLKRQVEKQRSLEF
jgi:hypothetical protein